MADQQLAAELLAFTRSIVYPAGATLASGVGVATGLAASVADALGAVDALAAGLALTATPLPQTNLLPFFTHVYFIPAATVDCPAFLHAAPALTAADELGATTRDRTKAAVTAAKDFFMAEG